ncbi:unnamed protein product [Polarella glacialis]|uniref:RRM domain-containing protein n=1 Tax=Polarella glacialis TaxID=89957 RepID=A0A813DSW3_POLGL|nr:unnamed protein product [Polarella glacialis]
MDVSLDDLIETSWEDGPRGKNGKGKGRGKGKGSGFSSKGRGSGGSGASGGVKLDMSLEEIVDNSWGGEDDNGRGKGSKGKGKDWGGKSFGKSTSGKSYGKGSDSWGKSGGGKGGDSWGFGAPSGPSPYWMEHDDRDDPDDDEDWQAPRKGKGKGKSKGGERWSSYDSYEESWDSYGKGSYFGKGDWQSPGGKQGSKGSWGGEREPEWSERGSFGGKGEGTWGRSLVSTAPRAIERGYGGSDGDWRRVEDEPRDRDARPAAAARGVVGRKLGSAIAAAADAARGGPPKRAREVPAAARRGGRPDDSEDDQSEDAPPPRARARTAMAPAGRSAPAPGPKSIKVTNIPKELKAQDVREAFEAETGKITLCELSKGTARITFQKAKDAQKAVETFDRGELNGKVISVVLER